MTHVIASAASAAASAASPALPVLGRHQASAAGARGLEGLGFGPGAVASSLQDVARQIESRVPLVDQLSQVIPAADFVFGGAMLLLIVLLHASGMRALTNRFERQLQAPGTLHSSWRPDLIMVAVVALMLMLHLLEIFAWAAALVLSGLVADWRAAGFFAANTYTTVGYGSFVLPKGWHMLAPIIAISGLFTFGWTGSVLVEVVRRCQEVKAAALRTRAGHAHPHEGPPPKG